MKKTKNIALYISVFALFHTSLALADANVTKSEENQIEQNRVTIEMPQVPEAPKVEAIVPTVVVVENNNILPNKSVEELLQKEKVVFSTSVAPPRFAIKKDINATKIEVGEIDNGRVTAYLHAPLLTKEEVKANLEKAGFSILAEHAIDSKGEIVSLVFTDKAMQEGASKKSRGFASTLRVVIDTQNKIVNISNPLYVMRAFMQDEYNATLAEDMLKRLRENFSDLKNSQDIVKFSVLERFHFMENMPYYQDMQVIATGNNEELLKKAKASKKIVYEQHLANGTIVLGVEIGKRTGKFVQKIGYLNAGLLPYPIIIENNEAKILDPRYYIAVMYPMLKMSQFMTIATVPGAITADCDKVFR